MTEVEVEVAEKGREIERETEDGDGQVILCMS
jgi:hypothetical protein